MQESTVRQWQQNPEIPWGDGRHCCSMDCNVLEVDHSHLKKYVIFTETLLKQIL